MGADSSRVVEDVHTSDPVGDSGVSPLSPPEQIQDLVRVYLDGLPHPTYSARASDQPSPKPEASRVCRQLRYNVRT